MKSDGTKHPLFGKLKKICLDLPDTKLTMTWGSPHFRVADKIFCGSGEEDGVLTVGFKLEKPHAARVLNDPRFSVAPYVGKHGWVHMKVTRVKELIEVRRYVEESYELIAPTKSLAKLKQIR
ncbi:MAG TPA: MmcQ/YjbR family DNA-binding protein [Planctomycetota bacterium]|nr:MmcQ/YjbR family DNA-binding protein [Planctomycetota bacterium]